MCIRDRVKVDPASEAKRLGSEREQVRAQRATKAAQINALQADDDKVSAALSDLSKNVSSQQDLLLEAQNGVRDLSLIHISEPTRPY